ncbi:MAG: M20/M25/M40 family metallo-hydrolase [Chitinophagales bacterium]
MKTFIAFAALFLYHFSNAPTISTQRIRADISFLASDKLKGRAPGTKGEREAQQYLIKQYEQMHLQPAGEDGYLQHFTYKTKLNPHDTIANGKTYGGSNVAAFLDNGKPYTIVIGAHYDHLGNDGRGSSLDANPKGKIHNGADDNASGTAGVLELARLYSSNNITEPCNFLFLNFSAEEAGLIGSKYFVNHPTKDLKTITAMINMDMIGRLNDSTQKLLIYGTGTSPYFEPLLKRIPGSFQLVLDSGGVGPSDQTSFYLKNIPVLHFFTGQHSDYHKPSDDVAKINFSGEVQVLEFIAQVVDSLSGYSDLKFQTTVNKEAKSSSFKVTLGIMPDYSYTEGGLRIDGVTAGKPGALAGLKAGDIIIRLGEFAVSDIYKYMDALARFKKGETTTLIFKRNNKELQTSVTF